MRGLVQADPIAAIVEYLSADADVATLCMQNVDPASPYPRIASQIPQTRDGRYRWKMPDYAILVSPVGGPAPDDGVGIHYCRFDLRCFGPGRSMSQRTRLANLLWRTVNPALCPPQGYPTSFHAANTIVQQVYAEHEGFPDVEPGTDWALWLCSYVVKYMNMRVAA